MATLMLPLLMSNAAVPLESRSPYESYSDTVKFAFFNPSTNASPIVLFVEKVPFTLVAIRSRFTIPNRILLVSPCPAVPKVNPIIIRKKSGNNKVKNNAVLLRPMPRKSVLAIANT